MKQHQGTESETRPPIYELRTYTLHANKVRGYTTLYTCYAVMSLKEGSQD